MRRCDDPGDRWASQERRTGLTLTGRAARGTATASVQAREGDKRNGSGRFGSDVGARRAEEAGRHQILGALTSFDRMTIAPVGD